MYRPINCDYCDAIVGFRWGVGSSRKTTCPDCAVDRWHEGRSNDNDSLAAYLGLTDEEYARWTRDGT